MNLSVIFFLAMVMFMSGCSTQRICISSLELNPRATQTQNRTATVAIAPLAGRVCDAPLGRSWSKSERTYMQALSTTDHVIPSSLVADKLSGDEEGLALYHALVLSLTDLSVQLSRGVSGTSSRINTKPWDGVSGIHYTNVLRVCGDRSGGNSGAPFKINEDTQPKHIKLDWILITPSKPIDVRLNAETTKKMGEKLSCRYLLVPVLADNFWFTSQIQSIYGIPLFRWSTLGHVDDLVLFMVDTETGSVIDAIRLPRIRNNIVLGSDLGVILSLQKILDRGSLMGRFVELPPDKPRTR